MFKDNVFRDLLAVCVGVFTLLNIQCGNPADNQSSNEKIDTVVNKSISTSVTLFDNDTIRISKIDSVQYFQARTEFFKPKDQADTLVYIEDFQKAKSLLKGRVTFGQYNNDLNIIDSTLDGTMIAKIVFSNGEEIEANDQQYFWDMGFWRYYPTEDILLCEGGHSSDFSFDLKNGIIGPEWVGNPDYINESPNKTYRLNGWFPGQECSDYFIQRKTSNGYEHLVTIPMDLTKKQFDLCTIGEIFWISENHFYFRNTYFGITDDERLGFFSLEIK